MTSDAIDTAGARADLGDLESRGYVVVRRFLPPEVVTALREDWESAAPSGNGNYPLRLPSPTASALTTPLVEALAAEVRTRTTLGPDLISDSAYFATGVADGIDFPWHQDDESWFYVQNHRDYLNFYMPVVKPDPLRSNLSIVPFDRLQARLPDTYRVVVGRGARGFTKLGRIDVAYDTDGGSLHRVRGSLDDLAETPELEAGDLLLVRGDIIHRTQDSSTARVALSVRVVDASTPVNRRRLVGGGLAKAVMMGHNSLPLRQHLQAFDDAGCDELPYGEVLARAGAATEPWAYTRVAFARTLLSEKVHSRQMARFVLDMPRAIGFGMAVKADATLRARRARVSRGA